MRKFLLSLTFVLCLQNSVSAQYVDPNFSIKDFKVFPRTLPLWLNSSGTVGSHLISLHFAVTFFIVINRNTVRVHRYAL